MDRDERPRAPATPNGAASGEGTRAQAAEPARRGPERITVEAAPLERFPRIALTDADVLLWFG